MRPTVLALLLFISACAPMAEIDLQIIEPADYTFPVHVQRLAFVNCIKGLPVTDTNTSELTIEKQQSLNSIVSKRAFEGVRKALVNSPMYQIDTIKLLNYERYRIDSIPVPLTGNEISYLNRIYPADALITLEKYCIRDSVETDKSKLPISKAKFHWLFTEAIWRIYDVSNSSVMDKYTYTRTFTDWQYSSLSDKDEMYDWPSFIFRNVQQTAYLAGINYGNRISPSWIQVPRYYYQSGGKGMRQAALKAAEDNWDAAAEIWKKIAYTEQDKTAAKACFNMALVCEMEDLMVPALDWANKSRTLKPDTLTNEYIKILKERSEHLDKLEKQVPGSE